MIVVQLTGGLGNQMFQYATARALAARRGTHLVLDSSWIAGKGGSVTDEDRRYELGCFEVDAPLVDVERVGRFRRSLLPSRRPLLHELAEPPFGQPCSEVIDAPDNTYLRGYWQNTTYFADAGELLRDDFSFRESVTETQLQRSDAPAVSIHVRRGDYVADPGVRDRMGTLEPEYYRRAVDSLASAFGDLQLVVITDDPDWCTANVSFDHETSIFSASRAERERWASLMRLMSQCDHHVLANSSFSWWGAWLNPSPDKLIVAPRPWLADSRWDEGHRAFGNWIEIDRAGHHADQPPSTTTFEPVT